MAVASSSPSVPSVPVGNRPATPLPVFKVAVIASVNMVNSVSYLMTYPFVPFLVMELVPGLDPNEAGFYSGMIEGSFHIGAFVASMPWGWFSDTVGRRPALLWGLAGTVVCCVLFGFSRSFGMALAIKFLWGALNSTVGVAKTCLSELTDDTNSARAFSYIGVATGFGRLIGPSIGGLLSEPAKRLPAWFDTPFWRQFPYLLPCLVGASMAFVTLAAAYVSLEETLEKAVPIPERVDGHDDASDEEAAACLPDTEAEVEEHGLLSGRARAGTQTLQSNAIVSRRKTAGDALHADFDGLCTPHVHASAAEDATSSDRIAHSTSRASRTSRRASSAASTQDIDVMDTPVSREAIADEQEDSTHTVTFAARAPARADEDGIELVNAGAARVTSARPAAPQARRRTVVHVLAQAVGALLTCGGSIQLLRDPAVRVSTVLYTVLGLLAIVGSENFPLYVLNDAEHGGFGWTSSDIGLIATLCGPPLIIYQAFVYDRLVRCFGVVRVARLALSLTIVLTALTPLCSLTLAGPVAIQWVVLSAHFSLTTICRVTSFTCIFIFVANSALPADRGKVNGLGQALASAVRAVGPAAGTALFAWSVSDANTAMGWPWDYHFTFYILALIGIVCLALTYALPPWISAKRDTSFAYGARPVAR